MKRIRTTALALFLFATSICSAQSLFRDYDFEQERMMCKEEAIYIISSFEAYDKMTAYSYGGSYLWETSFQAKVISWEIVGDCIIVLSKHRGGYKTYLNCLDRFTGYTLWERP